MFKWVILTLCLIPSLCFGAEGGAFSVAPTDKSMEYLGLIFGQIPGIPIENDPNPLIGSLFYAFNYLIFILGSIIVSYTVSMGIFNTANDGEFLGKQKWHPFLLPLRTCIGIVLLAPSKAGFCLIQIFVMWFVVQGVGIANSLWTQVIYYSETKSAEYKSIEDVQIRQMGHVLNGIFTSNLCMNTLNNDSEAQALLHERISVYRFDDRIEWGRHSHAGKEQALCGSIKIPHLQDPSKESQLVEGILSAQQILMHPADLVTQEPTRYAEGSAAFVNATGTLLQSLKGAQVGFDDYSNINKEAMEYGWIHAGSYYFQIVQTSSSGSSVYFSYADINTNGINDALGQSLSSKLLNANKQAAGLYAKGVSQQINPHNEKPAMEDPMDSIHNGQFFSKLFGDLMNSTVQKLTNMMTTSAENNDPMVSMATFGAWLTDSSEDIFWKLLKVFIYAKIGSVGVSAIGSLIGVELSLGKVSFLFGFFSFVAFLFITFVYLAGSTLALYIPLIPFLVYSFSAFSWLILVIESLLGATLIGLSFIVPSEDEMGKTGHAIIILLGLFLRPVLMVIGFIFGIQLMNIAIKMLNLGFYEALIANTGGTDSIGVFGMLAVLVVYVGIITTLTHEAFSLIYVLPNKVMRWISGTGDEDIAAQKTKELKGYFQKGANFIKGNTTGVIGEMSKKFPKR